jgi:hypothetical protein
MSETIENVRKDLVKWRRAHDGRRGPLPQDLRKRIADLARRLGEEAVSHGLDLDVRAVRNWQQRYGARQRRLNNTFIEVGSDATPIIGHEPGEMFAEVRDSNGTTVRLRGVFDAKTVESLLLAALSKEAEAEVEFE